MARLAAVVLVLGVWCSLWAWAPDPTGVVVAAALLTALWLGRQLSGPDQARPAAFLFCLTLAAYLGNGGLFATGDTVPAHFLPISLLRHGDLYLDHYPTILQAPEGGLPYYLRQVNGHYVSAYPVGAAMLAVPFYAPSVLAGRDTQDPIFDRAEKLSASVMVAASVAFLYLAMLPVAGARFSFWACLAYGLGTSSLSLISQGLWQHAPSQLCLTLVLYCLVRGRREPDWVGFGGLPMALAVLSRATDALLVVPLVGYVAVHQRRQLLRLALYALPLVVLQTAYNWAYLSSPWELLTTPATDNSSGNDWRTPLISGLAGVLFSPGRGLFLYSPFLVPAVIALVAAFRRGGEPLLRWLAPGCLASVVLVAKWYGWWGGLVFGPRLLADLTPVLTFSLFPMAGVWYASRRVRLGFAGLVAVSVLVHSIGWMTLDSTWNADVDVNRHPERLWSWSDNQIVDPVVRWVQQFWVAPTELSTPPAGGQPKR